MTWFRRPLERVGRLKELLLRFEHAHASELLLLAGLHAEKNRQRGVVQSLREVEFRIFSQFGDDGILQYLVHHLDIAEQTFVEFGVEDYHEATTRLLLLKDNWSGLVMDSSPRALDRLRRSWYFWRHDLRAKVAFITRENIDRLIAEEGISGEVGLLHIDIDGNDYWVWDAITTISPVLTVVEYNSVFGPDRAVTVPYRPDFDRSRAHHSNLYFGASLRALHHLATRKGYAFLGSNSAGNNAYFVRRDRLGPLREVSVEDGYVESLFRESRDAQGRLTFLRGRERLEAIRGLPVVNVVTGSVEAL
jgi:hypothetical protein